MSKKIGIIGGVGPQATAFIYQKIIESAQTNHHAVNNDDYPDLLIASVPVPDFISSREHIEEASQMLTEAAKALERAGCEVLCIGSNTVHVLLKDLEAEISVPFISMVELVAERCSQLGYSKVALLGTPILLNSGLYDAALAKRSIELIKPDSRQIETCDSVIRSIIAGMREIPVRKEYVEVLTSMFDQKADGIILGCTELPLVLDYEVLGKRVLSSDEILADGITDFYYSSKS
jgi:aspartate racemase